MDFITRDVWDLEPASMSYLRGLGIRAVRVVYLVFRGFKEDECPLHASSLTFNTLMAVVPILALSLALAGAFEGKNLAEQKLREIAAQFTDQFDAAGTNTVPDPVEVVSTNNAVPITGAPVDRLTANDLNRLVDAGLKQVDKINFAALGSLGFILLIWMVIAVLGRVESSFNRVWGVQKGRPLFRKFTDYLFAVIVLPFLITMASSLKIAELVARFDSNAARNLEALLNSGSLRTVTVLLMTVLTCTFILKFMPNTKVRFLPALAGGIVAALLFILWLWFCARIQVGVAKWSKFYGSFAIVPIVLAWVYVSWEIILFGAEVAFGVQNCATYTMEQGARKANIQSRIILALSVAVEAARAMTTGERRFDVAEYTAKMKIPVRFINEVVEELVKAGMLAALSEEKGGYVMMKSPDALKVGEVIDSIITSGVGPVDLGLKSIDPKIIQVARTTSGGLGGSARESSISTLL